MERDLNYNFKTTNPRTLLDVHYDTDDRYHTVVAWVLPQLPAYVKVLAVSQYANRGGDPHYEDDGRWDQYL
jgi:hypothetical protein